MVISLLDYRNSALRTYMIEMMKFWAVSVGTNMVKAMPILGGLENKARSTVRDSALPVQELVIRGTAIMGGIEIKN